MSYWLIPGWQTTRKRVGAPTRIYKKVQNSKRYHGVTQRWPNHIDKVLSNKYQTDKEKYQNNVSNRIFESIEPNPFEAKYSRKAAKKFYAYVYLENANKTKYNSILKNLNQ